MRGNYGRKNRFQTAPIVRMALAGSTLTHSPCRGISAATSNLVLGILFITLGVYFLLLTFWWPTMRYELDQDALLLRYGKAIQYRIPLDTIKTMRRANLGLSLWSSIRMPGVALFNVPYSDVGQVRMVSTAALNGIFLIETEHGLYGLTPAEEDRLAAAIQARIRR
jgi:hypothetical protein